MCVYIYIHICDHKHRMIFDKIPKTIHRTCMFICNKSNIDSYLLLFSKIDQSLACV